MSTKGVLSAAQQKLVGSTRPIRAELVSAGLWEEHGLADVCIHDWDEHNGKRDLRREQARLRMREHRANGSANSDANGSGDDVVHVPPMTVVTVVKGVKEVHRERDEIWDALGELLGEVTNSAERGRRNKAVALLRESGATAGEIVRRAANFRAAYTVPLTANGLACNWSALETRPADGNMSATEIATMFDEEVLDDAAGVSALGRGA